MAKKWTWRSKKKADFFIHLAKTIIFLTGTNLCKMIYNKTFRENKLYLFYVALSHKIQHTRYHFIWVNLYQEWWKNSNLVRINFGEWRKKINLVRINFGEWRIKLILAGRISSLKVCSPQNVRFCSIYSVSRKKWNATSSSKTSSSFSVFIKCFWGFIIDMKIITALQLFTMEVNTNLKTTSINVVNCINNNACWIN